MVSNLAGQRKLKPIDEKPMNRQVKLPLKTWDGSGLGFTRYFGSRHVEYEELFNHFYPTQGLNQERRHVNGI